MAITGTAKVDMMGRSVKIEAEVLTLTKLLVAISFIVMLSLGSAMGDPLAADGYVSLEDFSQIYDYIDKDNVKVKVKPGTFKLDRPQSEPLISFSGSNNHFDLTGVNLIADRPCNTIIALIGNNIILEGLHLETNESHDKCRKGLGTLGINITGNGNTLLNVSLLIQDSYPYGYGSMFGIGKGASVNLGKAACVRVGAADGTVIKDCNIVMRAFGHGIFIRGADKTLIEGTTVEGELRQTDEILVEKTGTAAEEGFLDFAGAIIRPGKITSLAEDGIRIYSDSGSERNYNSENGRKTGSVTVRNCTVKRMRRGICLALGGADHLVEGCTVIECARVGYNIGSGTIVKNCKGDAKYSQLLDIASSNSKNSNVELEVLDSRIRQGNSFENDPCLLAKVNGANHRLSIKPAAPDAVPSEMTIEIGGNVGWSSDSESQPQGKSIRVSNETAAWVLLHPAATECAVESVGAVVDYGDKNNTIITRK